MDTETKPHNVVTVTDETFEEEVLKASFEQPVVVRFWAPWCGPCKANKPVIEELSVDLYGHLKVVSLNTDENPQTQKAYTIRGIPSIYLFKNGVVVESIVGAVPKGTMVLAFTKHTPAYVRP